MAKKKFKKRSPALVNPKVLTASILTLLIVVVGYTLLRTSGERADASVTAPVGTLTRSEQIESSELSQETNLDDTYDTQQTLNAQSDGPALSQANEAVPHEN